MPYLGSSFCLSTAILYLNGKLRTLDRSTDKKSKHVVFSIEYKAVYNIC